ncbi:MAG: efflux RND transporter permease subunit [Alphaproteobacteria bacterium]|nr:efflux RND transporter permease subunit [Alphaproteobacteria bacterium]
MIRTLVRVGIDNPVLLNLTFLVVVLAGLWSWTALPKEEFPPLEVDRVIVFVGWPGATPEEVEDQLLRPIEDAIEDTEGLKHVYAEASEARALLTLEFVRGTDIEGARDAVIRSVDGLDDLPSDSLPPAVDVARLRNQLLHVSLVGDPRRTDVADAIASELLAQPGVAEVQQTGGYDRRVRVELDPARAAALGIGPQQVAGALQAAAVGAPAGSIDLDAQSVLVRVPKGLRGVPDLATVPLTSGQGSTLTVGDVARVTPEWVEPDLTVRVDGQPAIDLFVIRQDDADALEAVPRLAAWVKERDGTLPPGLHLIGNDDSARFVRDRLATLGQNGIAGLLLVAGVLALFIGLRNAALVVWGMPVAWLGAVLGMYATGTSINLISVFALLLVTGMIVDDAIVIVENVHRHLEAGKDRVTAAVDGTMEVMIAVASSSITTCLAFAPLMMLEGVVGRVMRIVPIVVILCLMASLFEAFFVLPGHLAHWAKEGHQEDEDNLPTRLLVRVYTPVLHAVTRAKHRGLALVALSAGVVAALSLGLVMRLQLTTPGEPLFAFVHLDLPPSADAQQTTAVVRQTEAFVAEHADDLYHFVRSKIGEQVVPPALPVWGARHGEVVIGFHNDPARLERVSVFLDDLRTWLHDRPDVQDVAITTLTGGPPVGKAIDLRVRGRDGDAAVAVALQLADNLAARPGVSDVRTEVAPGAVTFDVQVDPERAAALGLREADVALAVRAAMDGATAIDLPVDERTTEVRVALPAPTDRAGVADLPVRLPDGRTVRLRQVADVVRNRSIERIQRVDGERSVRITADVDADVTSTDDERAALDAAFAALPPQGLSLFWGGEVEDTRESFGRLPAAAVLATMLIYALLAVQFRSYVQPLIILAAVPLGLAGAILGLFAFGMDLSLIAMIGAVGLIGIVVNDSLVLVDFINRLRSDGKGARDAVVEASLVRLRPILITTVTTVLGLFPLAIGVAGKEPLLAPMAVSISVGLAFATALTLVVVPVLYLVLEDVGGWFRRGA